MAGSFRHILDNCDVQTFAAGGRGGQHQNRTESAVRLVHRPTGTTVICRDERSQHLNKLRCLEVLRNRLKKLEERPKPRIATALPQARKSQRREKKRQHSRKKELRRKPRIDD